MRNSAYIPDPFWIGMHRDDWEDFCREFGPWFHPEEDKEEDDEYDDEQD